MNGTDGCGLPSCASRAQNCPLLGAPGSCSQDDEEEGQHEGPPPRPGRPSAFQEEPTLKLIFKTGAGELFLYSDLASSSLSVAATRLQDVNSHRQCVNERVWLCSNKALFMTQAVGRAWSCPGALCFLFPRGRFGRDVRQNRPCPTCPTGRGWVFCQAVSPWSGPGVESRSVYVCRASC